MQDEELVPLFIPALAAILVNAEDKKGVPLSEQEVSDIRDKAAVMMVTREHASKMADSRGYADIDPENCWYDWQMLRRDLERKPDIDPGARFSQVRTSDSEFQATVISARNTLPVFRAMLAEKTGKEAFPLIKVLLSEPDFRAYMWLVVQADRASGFTAEIFELPSSFKNFQVGQTIEVHDADLQDWMITHKSVIKAT